MTAVKAGMGQLPVGDSLSVKAVLRHNYDLLRIGRARRLAVNF
jgi:hypothetical protein